MASFPSLEAAQKMSDEELVERLISVRGIGAWTVEMFLIFRLGRPDVLPIHDYGVQKGFAILYRKKAIPKAARASRFRRTLAALPHGRKLVHVGVPSDAPEKTHEKSQRTRRRRTQEKENQEGSAEKAIRTE